MADNHVGKREFWRGVTDCLPVSIAAAFFAITYGTVAAEKGLTFLEGMLLTSLVFAGASQFLALQFWDDPLPFVTIVLVVLAVNFRHILYGASISRKLNNFKTWQKFAAFFFLTDPNFALAEHRHEKKREGKDDPGLTPAYYFGTAFTLFVPWFFASAIGLLFGGLIENPEAVGIDFILPLYFLVLLVGFRARPNWMPVVVSAGVASTIAFLTIGSPWHISAGALVGVLVGAIIGLPKEELEQ